MRLSRLYCEQELIPGSELVLGEEATHYLGKVLRMKPGFKLALFNGSAGEITGHILAIGKRDIQIQLDANISRQPESLLPVHIGLGLSRGERMDYAVQKATELGVTHITPLFTEYSEVRLDTDRADKRTSHWQKIGVSAAEQCGRCTVPVIYNPATLKEWLTQVPEGTGYLLDHTGDTGFSGDKPESIFLLIGPEGGISDGEKQLALSHHFACVRLGPRILRTETAPVVALTALQMQWGDFRN